MLTRNEVMKYVCYCLQIDDPLCFRDVSDVPDVSDDVPDHVRIVGWQCGFEPMCVAVWSGDGRRMSKDDAEEVATQFLRDIGWFSEEPRDADFVL